MSACLFTDVQMLGKALQNEHCKLSKLCLQGNGLTNQCILKLCNALGNGHCKLDWLSLALNKLTDQCIPNLCKALESGHCKLTCLNLTANELTDQCIPDLCNALANKHCKLDKILLGANKLTDQCIPHVCKALESRTKLTSLSLHQNKGITNDGLGTLCKSSLTEGQQKKKLNLFGCSLSNDCIPYLRNAVKNEYFALKQLTLEKRVFSEEEQEQLHQLQSNRMKFELS